MAKNRVIGANNALPWHLPADLRYFKALTMGHHIIMGRKTFESIGRVLPGRTTVVVTRQRDFHASGAIVTHSIEQALAACQSDSEIFVVGGAELFKQVHGRADRLYITEIHADFEGDVYFPECDRTLWQETSREKHRLDSPEGFEYHFVVYNRKPGSKPQPTAS